MSTSEVQATVKWGVKSFTVQVDLNEPFDVFQAQLYTLTAVPVDRQKVLCKGKTLKTEEDLRAAAAAAGSLKLMLMGTAEDKTKAMPPAEKTVFVEDLTPEQEAALLREKQIEPLPNGIVNLGNTCYLAAVLQMLRPVSDLSDLIRQHVSVEPATAHLAAGGERGAIRRLCLALKDFYNQREQTVEAVTPYLLVPALREAFPQFSRRSTSQAGKTGIPMQQDAEECLSCLLSAVGDCLDSGAAEKLKSSLPYVPLAAGPSPLDLLFGVQLQVTSKRSSKGSNGEPTSAGQTERHRKLTCFLGTPQKPVSTLEQSLQFSLGDEIVQVGGSGASGEEEQTLIRSNKISSLALYLIVHFMRFEWKTGGTEAEKAKICRSVKFAQTLDLYSYCTEELQKSFKVGRAIVALRREREASASGGSKAAASAAADQSSGSNTTGGSPSPAGASEQEAAAAAATGAANSGEASSLMQLAGKPCPTGTYQLLSVVTHQGRYADSGHYVGWARADPPEGPQGPPAPQGHQGAPEGSEEAPEAAPAGPAAKRQKNAVMWRKFDDEKVTEVPWETLDLSGGRSDYHVAYLLLMKQVLVVPSEEELRAVQKQLE
ncbi:hypothetical protein Efla_005623 [Eimeria flavescens]